MPNELGSLISVKRRQCRNELQLRRRSGWRHRNREYTTVCSANNVWQRLRMEVPRGGCKRTLSANSATRVRLAGSTGQAIHLDEKRAARRSAQRAARLVRKATLPKIPPI